MRFKTMRYLINSISTTLLVLFCLYGLRVSAQTSAKPPARKTHLLNQLKKCVHPRASSGCDEESVAAVAQLYWRGDVTVLSALMDVAPNSDGALSEGLGDFFSQLLCRQPRTYLQAVGRRPVAEQQKLLMLAAAADGGGMGCQQINALRQKLKTLSNQKNKHLAVLAERCLVEVNKYN